MTFIPLLKEPKYLANRDFFGLYYFLKGEALKGLKKFDRAKQMFERVTAEDGHIVRETYLVPYSWVCLGEIALAEQDWTTAEQHFTKAKTYSDYDWAQLLSFRIYGDFQKLERRKAEQK